MTRSLDTPSSSAPRPELRLRVGPLTLGGPAAAVVALLLAALLVALLWWSKPSIGMWLAGGIWFGFLVFWSVTAGRHGSRKGGESAESRALHQNLLNLGLLLLFVSIPGLRWRYVPPNPWHVPVGLGIMAAATLLHIWARVHLGRNWSSEVMIKTDHQLVRSGPYRVVRHPIYTAILGLAAGTAIVSARVLSLAGAAVFAWAYARKIRIEERALGEEFGTAWEDYRKRLWALVPGLF